MGLGGIDLGLGSGWDDVRSGPPSLQSIHISIPPDISLESLSNLIPGTSVDAPTPHTILHLYKLIIAQAADLAGVTSNCASSWGPCSSQSGAGDPEVCAHVLLRDGHILWRVSAQMQPACIVALVTRFVEVLASPAASVDETHVPKLPEAPPEGPQRDNTSFYPAKHLADEFELIKKHNPRAIAQRASVGLNSLPDSTQNLPWRLRLAEIQAAVALRFGFSADKKFTNSLKEALSKNTKFGRMPRPRREDRLVGDWWFVVDHPPVQVEPRPVPSPRPDLLPPFHKFLLAISGPVPPPTSIAGAKLSGLALANTNQ
ncbi:hypothetical protein JB92DRAFT_3149716 [Gautieria morchelliformis]|nr:hypothetical protein JB92DRAFT_3149716 [Gautieria morchelliformis]